LNRKAKIKKQLRLLLAERKGALMIDLSQKYHVITGKDELLLSTCNFSQAWKKIRGQRHGTRLVRNDGVLLAYASTSAGGRIKKGFPKKVIFLGKPLEESAPEGAAQA